MSVAQKFRPPWVIGCRRSGAAFGHVAFVAAPGRDQFFRARPIRVMPTLRRMLEALLASEPVPAQRVQAARMN